MLETRIFYVGVDHDEILFSFALESGLLILTIGWHVFEQYFPGFASVIYIGVAILYGTPFQASCLSLSRSTILFLRTSSYCCFRSLEELYMRFLLVTEQ